MSFKRLSTFILIAGSILALSSCKKDEEDSTVAPSLYGNLTFQVPAYVAPGTEVTMTPSGVKHPDGKGVGFYWKVSDPKMEKPDTTKLESDPATVTGSFSYKFRDSLTTYTISCSAFAAGYGNSYTSKYVTVVKPGLDGSLLGTGVLPLDKKISSKGVDYYYISHDGLDWMRNNLANPDCGIAYSDADVMSTVFGRYYSYEEAADACPEGWRLPTDEEWRKLAAAINGKELADAFETIPSIAADFMANATFNLKTMWEYWPEVGDIKNTAKIAVIPSGYVNLGAKSEDGSYPMAGFRGLNEYAAFWTADTVVDEAGMAYYRYLICDQPDMYAGKGDVKTFGASVRCVRPSVNQ